MNSKLEALCGCSSHHLQGAPALCVGPTTKGLDLSALDSVFNAIIANKILYALPVYYGYLTQGHKEMLQRIVNHGGFTVREYDLEALAENAQYDLFHNSCSTCYRPLSESHIHGKSKTSRFHAA